MKNIDDYNFKSFSNFYSIRKRTKKKPYMIHLHFMQLHFVRAKLNLKNTISLFVHIISSQTTNKVTLIL